MPPDQIPAGPSALFDLRGRSAAVVGASSGLGSRFAEALAAAGARVVLAARREDRLTEVVSRVTARGGEAVAVGCDVRNEEQVNEVVSTAVESFGSLDVMVAAAGVAPDEDSDPESPKSFSDVLDVNATGVYRCVRAAGIPMIAAGRGSIIAVASISGLVAGDGPDTPSYAASKGAVVNLTRELGVRWAPLGVRVNAIAPGWFPSEMTADTLSDPEGREFVEQRTPIGRPGRVHELDGALVFLASEASSYVTGQTLVIDGGWTAR